MMPFELEKCLVEAQCDAEWFLVFYHFESVVLGLCHSTKTQEIFCVCRITKFFMRYYL